MLYLGPGHLVGSVGGSRNASPGSPIADMAATLNLRIEISIFPNTVESIYNLIDNLPLLIIIN